MYLARYAILIFCEKCSNPFIFHGTNLNQEDSVLIGINHKYLVSNYVQQMAPDCRLLRMLANGVMNFMRIASSYISLLKGSNLTCHMYTVERFVFF